jgi:hypothetical protein
MRKLAGIKCRIKVYWEDTKKLNIPRTRLRLRFKVPRKVYLLSAWGGQKSTSFIPLQQAAGARIKFVVQ